ncbi:unnamed protein product, partial [Musa hybrid cultivar]
MSGAQGAQPKESLTPTTYESVPTEENKTRLDPRSKEDEGMIKIEKQQDKVEDAAGGGGPVFGAGKEEHKPDLGVTGTGRRAHSSRGRGRSVPSWASVSPAMMLHRKL